MILLVLGLVLFIVQFCFILFYLMIDYIYNLKENIFILITIMLFLTFFGCCLVPVLIKELVYGSKLRAATVCKHSIRVNLYAAK